MRAPPRRRTDNPLTSRTRIDFHRASFSFNSFQIIIPYFSIYALPCHAEPRRATSRLGHDILKMIAILALPCPALPGPAPPCPAKPCRATPQCGRVHNQKNITLALPRLAKPCQARPCQALPGPAPPSQAKPCRATPQCGRVHNQKNITLAPPSLAAPRQAMPCLAGSSPAPARLAPPRS